LDLTDHHAKQIAHERKDVSEMQWSPDGSRIVYSTSATGVGVGPTGNNASTSLLKVVVVRTGAVERIAGSHRSPADFGTWSPDGSRIPFMTGHGFPNENYGFGPAEIWTVAADGTSPQMVLSLPGRAFALRWSPDGSELAFSAPDGDAFSSYVVDVNTHEVRRVAPVFLPVWLNDQELIVHIGG
jgi:Tol biopolymer transport system component